MKKFLLTLVLCGTVCSSFASMWTSAEDCAATVTSKTAHAWGVLMAKCCTAYWNNPSITYADYKEVIAGVSKEDNPDITDAAIVSNTVINCVQLANGKFVEDVIADETVHDTFWFRFGYKLGYYKHIPAIVTYSATIEDKDVIYEVAMLESSTAIDKFSRLVDKYIADNVFNKDTAILEKFYAISYDKLNDTKWQPIITKIALNLRRRGVNVQ